MSFLDRVLIISVVLLASVFPVELFPNTGPVPRGGDGQFSGKQGAGRRHGSGPEGRRKRQRTVPGCTVSCFRIPPSEEQAISGCSASICRDEPGAHELTVDAQLGEQTRHFSFQVLVVKEKFAVEHPSCRGRQGGPR